MLSWLKIRTKWYLSRLLERYYVNVVKRRAIVNSRGKKHDLPGKLVVSLTSYKPRFCTLMSTIRCLTCQSVWPDELILWVSETDYADVPRDILSLESAVKQFKFSVKVTADYGPYKKIIPTLSYSPNAFIVTADDDLYYGPDWLKNLICEYDAKNNEVIANVVHSIAFNDDGTILPYNIWQHNNDGPADPWYGFPVGYGGVFYPPNCFDSRVTDSTLFMTLSPKADDPWLYWMAKINGFKTKKARGRFRQVCWQGSQSVALLNDNVAENSNDGKIQNLYERFGVMFSDK